MPKEGFEPSRDCSHHALNVARLPVPPLRLAMLASVADCILSQRCVLSTCVDRGSIRVQRKSIGDFFSMAQAAVPAFSEENPAPGTAQGAGSRQFCATLTSAELYKRFETNAVEDATQVSIPHPANSG